MKFVELESLPVALRLVLTPFLVPGPATVGYVLSGVGIGRGITLRWVHGERECTMWIRPAGAVRNPYMQSKWFSFGYVGTVADADTRRLIGYVASRFRRVEGPEMIEALSACFDAPSDPTSESGVEAEEPPAAADPPQENRLQIALTSATGAGDSTDDPQAIVNLTEPLFDRAASLRTNIACNLRCTYCSVYTKPEYFEYDEIIEAIRVLRERGAMALGLTGGEPALHPRILDIVRYGMASGLRRIWLGTNGIALADKQFTESIVEAGVSIFSFSLDSFNAELQTDLFRGAKVFDKVMAGLKNAHAQPGVAVLMPATITSISMSQLPEHIDWVADFAGSQVGRYSILLNLMQPPSDPEQGPRLRPDLLEATRWARMAIARGIQRDLRVMTSAIPPCLLGEFAQHSMQTHIRETSVPTVAEIPFLPISVAAPLGVHPDVCTPCRWFEVCPGIRPEYETPGAVAALRPELMPRTHRARREFDTAFVASVSHRADRFGGLIKPRETGAIAQFLVPVVSGVLAARGSLASLAIAVAALALLLAWEPFLILAKLRGSRLRLSRGSRATRQFVLSCLVAVTATVVFTYLAPPLAIRSLVVPALPVAVMLGLTVARRVRTALGEVSASLAMGTLVLPIALAGGGSLPAAAQLAGVLGAIYSIATLAVRRVTALAHGVDRIGTIVAPIVAAVVAFVAATVLVTLGLASPWLPLVMLPVPAYSMWITARPPHLRRIRAVGWILAACTGASAVLSLWCLA